MRISEFCRADFSSLLRAACLVTAVLIALAGCGGGDGNTVFAPEPEPVTSATFRIVAYPGGTVLAGASYEIVGQNIAGTADQDGIFNLNNLRRGNYQLEARAPGYAPTRFDFATDSKLSIFKLNDTVFTDTLVETATDGVHFHFTVHLVELSGDLELHVVDGRDGTPLAGVEVELAGANYPFDPFDPGSYSFFNHHLINPAAIARGVSDASGTILLTGVPAISAIYQAKPLDADQDGRPEYNATAQSFIVLPDQTTVGYLRPPAGGNEGSIIFTNYNNSLLLAPSLIFLLSEPASTSPGNTQASLYPYYSSHEAIPLHIEWVSPTRLEVTPTESLADPHVPYFFLLRITMRDGSIVNHQIEYFNWLNGKIAPAAGECHELVSDLELTADSSDIDFDTTSIFLTWPAVSCAGGYKIYARDSYNNPGWQLVAQNPTDYTSGSVVAAVNLPGQFDRFTADASQTPFAATAIDFSVVPLESATPDPGPPHGTLTLADNTPPLLTEITQVGVADNHHSSELILKFRLEFSEFISENQNDPTIEFMESGGDPAYVLTPAIGRWNWHAGRKSGEFVFFTAPGQNAAGDLFRVTFQDLTDLSGNGSPGQEVTAWRTIGSGSTFDFETSRQGWSRDGQSWELGTPTIGPQSCHNGLTCWGTSLHANYGPFWDTTLVSPPIRVPASNPELNFWSWYDIDYSDNLYVEVVDQNEIPHQLNFYRGAARTWTPRNFDLSLYAGQVVRLRFHLVSDGSYEDPGFFLDDLTISGQ